MFQAPAAGGARSGKRSRDLERQGLDVDAHVQREALRLSRRVQVVRQSTGEVVADHESAKHAARALGIPVGSVWNFMQKQKAKDGLLVRAAIEPSTLCGGIAQGFNHDLACTRTGEHEVAAVSSPDGVHVSRSMHIAPADDGDGDTHRWDDGDVPDEWDQWARSLSPCLLQSQAICMAFDEQTGCMVVPTPDSKTYQGYVESVGESSCLCWFDDHSQMDVPQALVRQCSVRPDPTRVTKDDGHCLEAAALIVDVCARVWGAGVMPPCIRDPRDGKNGSAVFLVFNPKTIYTGGRGGVGNPTDVVDHTSAAQVEFLELDRVTGLAGTAVCSQCHSYVQRRNVIMTARTGKAKVLDACPHIVAVRHIATHKDPEPRRCDHLVDASVARTARRFSCPEPSPSADPDATDLGLEGGDAPHVHRSDDRAVQDDEDDCGAHDLCDDGSDGEETPDKCVRRPAVSLLPTSSTCHFMVLQVHAPVPSHPSFAWNVLRVLVKSVFMQSRR